MRSFIIIMEILAVMFLFSCENNFCHSVTYEAAILSFKNTASDAFYCPQMESEFNINSKQAVGDWMGKTYVFVQATDQYNNITEKPVELPDTFTIVTLKECKVVKAAPNTKCASWVELTFSVTDDKGFITGCQMYAPPSLFELMFFITSNSSAELKNEFTSYSPEELTLSYKKQHDDPGYHLIYKLTETTPKKFNVTPQ